MTPPKVAAFVARQGRWRSELAALRDLLLAASLDEDLKWGKPCYGAHDKNIAILQPMKEHVALMFFQGAQMADPAGILEAPGPNSQIARRACFRDVATITSMTPTLQAYVREAIALAQSAPVVEAPRTHRFTPELLARLEADAAFQAAFAALTPGRQREYDLQVAGAKQAATRERRIDGFVERVLAGKGFRDA